MSGEVIQQVGDSPGTSGLNSFNNYLHENFGTVQQMYAEPSIHKNNAWGDQIHN